MKYQTGKTFDRQKKLEDLYDRKNLVGKMF